MDIAKTKVELDVEKHLLSTTVKLSDGSTGNVFTRSAAKNEAKIFTYNCHLCGVPNLPGERCLQTHIAGRKHQTKLSMPIIDAETFRAPLVRAKNQITMQIAPGEPVPPGFENEVKQVAELQSKIDKCKDQALIGLEYVMELTMGEGNEPEYHCVLCDKRGDHIIILAHIQSYGHRLRYLEKHFPTVVREITPYRFNRDARNVMPQIIQNLCEAIEDAYGRLTPTVHEHATYSKNRLRYLQEAFNDKHLDEKLGSTFVNIVDRKLILDTISSSSTTGSVQSKRRDPTPPKAGLPKKNRTEKRSRRASLDSISSISSSSLSSPRKSPCGTSDARIIGTIDLRSASRSLSPKKIDPIAASKLVKPVRETEKRLIPTPRELEQQALEISHERYKWEKFRCTVEIAVAELDKKLAEHEKNPEKHPLYPDEWKKFWNRRYKELQHEKKDPTKHDFKPEWIIFWTKRMKELHLEEIEKKKMEIRKKMNLPDDGKERTDELKQQYAIKIKLPSNLTDEGIKTKNTKHQSSTTKRSENSRSSRSPRRSRSPRSSRSPHSLRSSHFSRSSRRSRQSRSPVYDRMGRHERSHKYDRVSSGSNSTRNDRVDRHFDRNNRSPNQRERSRERMERMDNKRRSRGKSIDRVEQRYVRDNSTSPPPTAERYVRETSAEYYRHEPKLIYDDWPPRRPPFFVPTRLPRPMHPGLPRIRIPAPYFNESDKLMQAEVGYEEPEDEPLTVVSVLRLLTALEDLLGSLGPKVIDLLAKALALEKLKANSSDDILLNESNCVIFETVKEKLKGQLIAGMVESPKVGAVKKSIKNIAALIHVVHEKLSNVSKTQENDVASIKSVVSPPSAVVESSNDEMMDKVAIAKKITDALIAQGKTDLTTDQLEQLIVVYTNMARKAKETKTMVTTASYLAQSVSEEKPILTHQPLQRIESLTNDLEKVAANSKNQEVQEHKSLENDDEVLADAANALESLTDSDLQTLLQNFKDLSAEEQQHLIAYLKKMEISSPSRVEKLRKFVNVDFVKSGDDKKQFEKNESSVSNEIGNTQDEIKYNNDSIRKKIISKKLLQYDNYEDGDNEDGNTNFATNDSSKYVFDSDDEDDYTYDDVFRAASKNVKEKQLQDHVKTVQESLTREREGDESNVSRASTHAESTSSVNVNMSITDTQSLIANLMGSLQRNMQSSVDEKQQSSSISTMTSSDPIQSMSNLPFYQQQNMYYKNLSTDYRRQQNNYSGDDCGIPIRGQYDNNYSDAQQNMSNVSDNDNLGFNNQHSYPQHSAYSTDQYLQQSHLTQAQHHQNQNVPIQEMQHPLMSSVPIQQQPHIIQHRPQSNSRSTRKSYY